MTSHAVLRLRYVLILLLSFLLVLLVELPKSCQRQHISGANSLPFLYPTDKEVINAELKILLLH